MDVGVTMPVSGEDGLTATARYATIKNLKYRPYMEELRTQGITYKPVIWSTWGRARGEHVRERTWGARGGEDVGST